MKGLLYKDLYVLLRQYKYFLLMAVIFSLFTAGVFTLVLSVTLLMSVMALDEQSGWIRLSAALPLSRWQLVLSKYLLGFILALCATALGILGEWIMASIRGDAFGAQEIAGIAAVLSISLCLEAISLPPMFKFGVEKGRMWIMLVMLLSMGGFAALNSSAQQALSPSQAALPLIALALLAISAPLSIRIFSRRAL